ncbi:imidazolonepropionase [Acetomicrobium mobile DSM 13181]|uniref:Imidazolonepropionase n=1 Tax=Acetomicrobium mobile (strain ATCC BAA-54 / DSM 13181 / JCM 12221 / NGA) TaxID=891968 RepID=I4BVQ4_ACEMN|nr:imidazolonepropionase [Acetomicrobium mobile DSM 13181]
MMTLKLFRNARIYTPIDDGKPLAGNEMGYVAVTEEGALIVEEGYIASIGQEGEILESLPFGEEVEEIDLEGRCIIPGFVDPHTHACFMGTREREFVMRLQGASYLDILKMGGGILSTVDKVRSASKEELYENTKEVVSRAAKTGITTIEIKSGYGLSLEHEIKMLEVIDQLNGNPLDVVPTFMGAHAIPMEYKDNPKAYVELVIDEMIPYVAKRNLAKYCDVFCEEGVFSVEDARRILQAARGYGLGLKLHADEVYDLGGAKLAAELKVDSAEHLLAASDEGLRAMAQNGILAVLLPATAFSLRKPFARARRMMELGVPVALATDCNPGSCYCESMEMVYRLAVLGMGLSMEEALTASTLNAAYAIGMARQVGSLQRGKKADFVVLEGETPGVMAYHLGASNVKEVYKMGKKI